MYINNGNRLLQRGRHFAFEAADAIGSRRGLPCIGVTSSTIHCTSILTNLYSVLVFWDTQAEANPLTVCQVIYKAIDLTSAVSSEPPSLRPQFHFVLATRQNHSGLVCQQVPISVTSRHRPCEKTRKYTSSSRRVQEHWRKTIPCVSHWRRKEQRHFALPESLKESQRRYQCAAEELLRGKALDRGKVNPIGFAFWGAWEEDAEEDQEIQVFCQEIPCGCFSQAPTWCLHISLSLSAYFHFCGRMSCFKCFKAKFLSDLEWHLFASTSTTSKLLTTLPAELSRFPELPGRHPSTYAEGLA